MKRLILILTITIFISSSIFSQWVNLKPVSDGNYLTSVYFINDNIGWMAGSDGFITKTENAGEVWQRKESNTNVQLRSIFFVNRSVGWCVGDGGTILKSNNGGDIWEIQLNDTLSTFNSVQFINEDKGWIVGSDGTILKTENGGIKWEIVDVGITNHLNSLFFVNQLLGFIIGNGGLIMKTVDGGTTWEHSFVSGDLLDVTFVNNSVGWISGVNQIQKTTDGGLHWKQVFSGITSRGIQFINENFGVAVLDRNNEKSNLHSGGDIMTTTDGGVNWVSSSINQWHIESLNSIYITNTGVGFVVGERGAVCITVDSGLTWNLSYSGNGYIGGGITDIAITTQNGINSLIAVGSRAATQGEGSAVQYRPITGTDYWVIDKDILYDPYGGPYLEFINDSVGYAYFTAYALKTYDRGNTWTWGVSETENKSLDRPMLENGSLKMFFVDENLGFWQQYAYEDPFFLVRTTNSGLNWEYIADQNLSLRSFHFFDENNGIAASETKIYKTTNAGLNWFEIFNQGGREILFINSFVGFVVGGNGNIFKTTNAGTDWFQVNNSGVSEDLNDLFFIDENKGYIVGNQGVILATTNEGNNWFQQDLGMNHNLHSVIFLDDNIGYIAGGGALLKTENGGGVIPVELVSLTATIAEQEVILNWSTATETNNNGFEVQRKLENSNWNRIGFKEGHGTTTEIQNYQFIDDISDIQATALSYRLKQIDFDGSFEYSEVVEVTNLAPTEFILHQNYPNPFNPNTKIKYALPQSSKVNLTVYNAIGEAVIVLVNEVQDEGFHEIEFDASSAGGGLPSGIYLYRLIANDNIQVKKMILLK